LVIAVALVQALRMLALPPSSTSQPATPVVAAVGGVSQ
jgi:hypothetical protein